MAGKRVAVAVRGQTYPSLRAFYRHIETTWGVNWKLAKKWWYQRLTPEEIEAKAEAMSDDGNKNARFSEYQSNADNVKNTGIAALRNLNVSASPPESGDVNNLGLTALSNLNVGENQSKSDDENKNAKFSGSPRNRKSDKLPLVVNGRSYASQWKFYCHLRRHYQVSATSLIKWRKAGASPEEIVKKARALKSRRSPHRYMSGEVVVAGWVFNSLAALCKYYGFNLSGAKREKFRYREGTAFHFFMSEFAPLWANGYLNQYNRWPPEREAKLPKSCLPLNEVQEPITDELERSCYNNIASFREVRPSPAKARIRLSPDA